ncbi:MAG: hypothetical protein IRY97_01985, partial [Thermomicrobiaceae bacterium]|nr:hypothetical protein [Thermomicrobiaceae bacterium]
MAITSWDVVVLGAANTDFIVQGHRLPRPGESLAGETFRALPGGTGANQAIAAARLGARVARGGRAGTDDRGDEIVH